MHRRIAPKRLYRCAGPDPYCGTQSRAESRMKTSASVGNYFPRPLLMILAASLPIAVACYYLAQLRDVRPPADTMSPAAVATRLAPVARLLPAADAKVAAAYPAAPSTN